MIAISFAQPSLLAEPGASYSVSSLLSVAAAPLPEYLVLTGLDRERYAVGSNGDRGVLSGNGRIASFSSLGSDCYYFAIVFSASDGAYYNSTYGYLSAMSFRASTDNQRTECLSLYGFGTAGNPNSALLAKLEATIADPNFAGLGFTYASLSSSDNLAYLTANYLGTLDVVTRSGYTDASPNQATPNEIAAVAASFVGQAWNQDGCWNLACNIAATAGASLPLTSTKALPGETPPVANGEWFVAYNSTMVATAQQKEWVSLLRPGDVVVANNTCGGHVATVVSGLGYAARLIDNYGSSANDGSAMDVTIRPAHDLANLIIPADIKNIVIYRLDAPVVTANRAIALAANGVADLASLFTVYDPGGRAITSYQIYDEATGGGTFLVEGRSYAAHSPEASVSIPAASLGNSRFAASTAIGGDTIHVRAFNGSYWGDWQSVPLNVGAATQPPVLQVPNAVVQVHGGQSIALSSLIVGSAADSPITTYTITDPGICGYLQLNGVSPLNTSPISGGGMSYEVAAADYSKLSFVGGSNIGGETLSVVAHNAAALPSLPATVAIGTVAPTVAGVSHYVARGADLPLAALFSVTQFDNKPLVSISINTAVTVLSWGANVPSSGGTVQFNGVATTSFYPGYYQFAAADLDQVTYRAAPDTGAQLLEFSASDGAFGIGGTAMITTVSDATPVVATPKTVAGGRTIAASSLFALAAGVTAPSYYRFLDPSGGGYLQLDPAATNLQSKSDATPGAYLIRQSDLAMLSYVGGAANASEALTVSTSTDNFHWTAEAALEVTTTGVVTGSSASDTFGGAAGGRTVNGGAGINTVVYDVAASTCSIAHTVSGGLSIQTGSGAPDTLNDIQRIQFADRKLAFDLSPSSSAGATAELLGAVFGKSALANSAYVGAGLSLFDAGWTMQQVAQLCLDKGFVGGPDNPTFVSTVWRNVCGSAIDAANLAYFTGRLDGHLDTQASLLVTAATAAANILQIDLVGLANNGIAYA